MEQSKDRGHSTLISTRDRLRFVDRTLRARLRRVQSRLVFILQASLGAGLSYWVASDIFGHPQPFFAPMSVVIILGLSGGERLSRAIEMSAGGILAVALGDTIFRLLSSGPERIAIVVAVALIIGSFLTKSALVSSQVAIGCILIATSMTPGSEIGGLERAIDAIIGSVIGILSIALIPNSPLSTGRNEISNVLSIASSVLSDVAHGLREKDPEIIRQARDAVRGTQADINKLQAATKTGKEATSISPLMWGSIRQIRSMERILDPVDSCVRGVRVIARRALVLGEDNDELSQAQLELLDELAEIALALGHVYDRKSKSIESREIPQLVHRLRHVGARAGMDVIENKNVLSAYAILAQTRSIVVDLLMVCGMSRESAVAVLVPTSEHPAYPPEIWDRD